MSDFVEWQVARAMASERPAIRPRLPSLFEPAAGDPVQSMLTETSVEVDAAGRESGPAPRSPALADATPPRTPDRPRGLPRDARTPAPSHRAAGDPAAGVETAEEVERPSLEPPPTATTDHGATPTASAAPGRANGATRRPPPPAVPLPGDVDTRPPTAARAATMRTGPKGARAPRLPHEEDDDGGEAPARPGRATAEPPTAAAFTPAGRARRFASTTRRWPGQDADTGDEVATPPAPPLLRPPAGMPAPATIAARQAARGAHTLPHQRGARANAPAAGDWAGADGPDAEPTIEVTIGRIDVRAAAAPAPAAPARTSQRKPSELELYLQQKGARRS